jgi:TnpA family transposase
LASIEAGTAKPAIILNHLLAQPHHPAAQGLVELGKLGKLEQSSYALQYGINMDLRRFVVPFTAFIMKGAFCLAMIPMWSG